MKVALVYNRDSKSVINQFGQQNLEKYGQANIKRIVAALKDNHHQVLALEGDKDLVAKLEEFMPKVLQGERPGMVLNLAYGIQGIARYTHVPGILEMLGVPYVGSGPLAHSLCLDKVVAKMIFQQHGISTPGFAVLESKEFETPDMEYPLIVKPKGEAVSFGIQIVNNEAELREAANAIFDKFSQPVLVERYIEGREINVGILGNSPPRALPVVELEFGDGPRIYRYEDKTKKSGREVKQVCPAPLDEAMVKEAQHLACRAFTALGCFDCARVDMRIAEDGTLYVLEINSLPSLGKTGSYVFAAAAEGMDFPKLVQNLLEVATTRYFGTPQLASAPVERSEPGQGVFNFVTQRRDAMEKRVAEWVRMPSPTDDAVLLRGAAERLGKLYAELGLKRVEDLTDDRSAWTFATEAGFEGGTLLIAQLDAPNPLHTLAQPFRLEPEWLRGEGVGTSRGPLVSMEFALRALRSVRKLRGRKIGVLLQGDEGLDGIESSKIIAKAAAASARVLVLRPGNVGDKMVSKRRGHRTFRVVAEEKPERVGREKTSERLWMWTLDQCRKAVGMSDKSKQVSIALTDLNVDAYRLHGPHRMRIGLTMSYGSNEAADAFEADLEKLFAGAKRKVRLERRVQRPPMVERDGALALYGRFKETADKNSITLEREASVTPSPAGLVPKEVPVLCGVGPVARDLYTPNEALSRISLVQRTLLLAQFLLGDGAK